MNNIKNSTQLLVSAADPLLMHVRIKNHKKILSNIFNNLFVGVAFGSKRREPAEVAEIVNYFNELRGDDKSIEFIYPLNETQNHGMMIAHLVQNFYDRCGDNILFMEDDDFILNSRLLKTHVDALNEGIYDFVGDPRGCVSNFKLIDQEIKYMKEDKVLYNHDGPCSYHFGHYWPTHFLIKKKFVKKDDIFRAHLFEAGETIFYRGRFITLDEECHSDTFVKFSIEMMSRINKGFQYDLYDCKLDNIDSQTAYFFHMGMIEQKPYVTFDASIYNKIAEYYIYHIGSASCLNRFHVVVEDDLLQADMFVETIDRINMGDLPTVSQIYRRYHVYKAIFEAVKDDPEMKIFRERYLHNFNIADKFYRDININGLMESIQTKFIPPDFYTYAFKQIVGI
tara:strand:+ start:3179 stop:4363 length:1185 start_codon:yes stop_codon:yes gene_type:complete